MTKHYNIKIFGVVQGVFFRASVKEVAYQLTLTGFVCNEIDGSVYLEAEGEEQKLNELVKWCHHGPSKAKIEYIEVKKGVIKSFEDFIIKR